ncbi:MAG: transposase, partial [Lentisphaeria bacterium]|nr:transposase [Lentisphaeria bacterium]
SMLVEQSFEGELLSGSLFVFCNRHRNGTQVEDISVLKGMPLMELGLPATAKGIELLRTMKELTSINSKSQKEFWKFRKFKKKYQAKIDQFTKENPKAKKMRLDIKYNRIYLQIHNITDIAALKGIPLEKLFIYESKLTSLDALIGMPLIQIDLDISTPGFESLRDKKTLKKINYIPVEKFWKEYDSKKEKK